MVARTLPQTPLQHAQRHGQQRGVAHTPLAGQHLRRSGGRGAHALHTDPLAGGLLADPRIPARIPDRSGPLARKPHTEHHPPGLDGAHDERHAHLQRKHRADHGGQDPRGADAARLGQPPHVEQGARHALPRRFDSPRPDGGRRTLFPRRRRRLLAAEGARVDPAHDPHRGHHHRRVRHRRRPFRREDRRSGRRPARAWPPWTAERSYRASGRPKTDTP